MRFSNVDKNNSTLPQAPHSYAVPANPSLGCQNRPGLSNAPQMASEEVPILIWFVGF
jgi:hypothetical protein